MKTTSKVINNNRHEVRTTVTSFRNNMFYVSYRGLLGGAQGGGDWWSEVFFFVRECSVAFVATSSTVSRFLWGDAKGRAVRGGGPVALTVASGLVSVFRLTRRSTPSCLSGSDRLPLRSFKVTGSRRTVLHSWPARRESFNDEA